MTTVKPVAARACADRWIADIALSSFKRLRLARTTRVLWCLRCHVKAIWRCVRQPDRVVGSSKVVSH